MPPKQVDSVEARARAYYAFQDLPMSEIVCAGERSVPKEPPDEYYLSIGGSGEEENVQYWLTRRRWSQRLVIAQLLLLVAAAIGFGEIFDLSTCGGSCPKWKTTGFFASVISFVVFFCGSIFSACTVRIAQSKLDQVHHHFTEQGSISSRNSVSEVSREDTGRQLSINRSSSSACLV
mgnify:CR=1 FL=1